MLLLLLLLALSAPLLFYGAHAQGAVQTFFPASIPLAVRSPYLSTWQNATSGQSPLSSSWPVFWTQRGIMGWAGKIRVDNTSYAWLGNDTAQSGPNVSTVTNVQITPTRSIYVMRAGPMNVTVTFLSPIEPSDFVNQSFPFSYVSVEASATDNAAHSVQVYSDISTEWASGDRSVSWPTWASQTTSSSRYHQIQIMRPITFHEDSDQAQDGTAYYAMPSASNTAWQISEADATRNQFIATGTLNNTAAPNAEIAIDANGVFTVCAFSIDLGNIKQTSTPVTWSIGYVRNPSIKYSTSQDANPQTRVPYFLTRYPDIGSAIEVFSTDFSGALSRATNMDQKITGGARKISSNYADLVSLAARQVMGSMDITVLRNDADGSLNGSDVKIFIKDIGGSGRVNAVERMYEALPAYLYFNASLCSGMLAPLLGSQDRSAGVQYPYQDIGGSYPTAVAGSSDDNNPSSAGIDKSGTMLVMMYAHARFSGDGSLLLRHYNLAKRWAEYLVQTTTIPDLGDQQFIDQKTQNLTNLALKGILGIQAMAEISRATGNDADVKTYSQQATSLMDQWKSSALSSDQQRILGVFGEETSWSLTYNLYTDLLLGTNLVPTSILENHARYLGTRLTAGPNFGLPIDNNAGVTSSTSWLLFAAAAVTSANKTIGDSLTQGVWNRANSNATVGAFMDYYNDDGSNGVQATNGTAGPSVGAVFSHLALTLQNQTIDTSLPSGSGGSTSSSHTGAIVGSVVGSAAAIVVLVAGLLYYRRRRSLSRYGRADGTFVVDGMEERHAPAPLSPYPYSDSHGHGTQAEETIGDSSAQSPPQQHSVPPLRTKAEEIRQVAASGYMGGASVEGTSGPDGSDFSQSAMGTAAQSTSPTEDVVGLREEVQDLRRAMQQIQAERFEAPPGYEE